MTGINYYRIDPLTVIANFIIAKTVANCVSTFAEPFSKPKPHYTLPVEPPKRAIAMTDAFMYMRI